MLATMYFGFNEMKGWGSMWIILPYLLWGLGRGSYESVNRAALADFYRGSKADAAFANFTFQQCTASALAFFMNRAKVSVVVTTIMACLIMPFYGVVRRRADQRERVPLIQDSVLSAIFTCSRFQKETNLSLLGSSSLCHDAAMAPTRCDCRWIPLQYRTHKQHFPISGSCLGTLMLLT
eukprot:symbB.v1.2.011588.t1/scaffold771.1/size163808/8